MMEENHLGWKIVCGVRRDVVNLFKLFADTNSVRFEDFCKVWKDMRFSLIFSHRVSFIELLEFSEELLQIVKEYLSSIYEFHTRVAALYALYGLYFKQPIRGAAKIRFTKTEWEDVYNLIEKSKKAGHFDVAFIFAKLYLNGAYNFVATVRPAGLERGFRKYLVKRSILNKVVDVELFYRPLISENLVNSLVKLESLYCRKKAELLGDKNLMFIDGNFAESLKEELENYKSKCQGSLKETPQDKSKGPVKEKPKNNTEVGSDSGKVSKSRSTKKTAGSKDEDEEIDTKKRKFSKKQMELIAKKKAEFYIQKLQQNNQVESDEKSLSLDPIELSD